MIRVVPLYEIGQSLCNKTNPFEFNETDEIGATVGRVSREENKNLLKIN